MLAKTIKFTNLLICFFTFITLRLCQRNELIHPITFNENGANMDGSMFLTFLVALAAMITLSVTMYLIELRGKRIDDRLRAIRRLAGGEA